MKQVKNLNLVINFIWSKPPKIISSIIKYLAILIIEKTNYLEKLIIHGNDKLNLFRYLITK